MQLNRSGVTRTSRGRQARSSVRLLIAAGVTAALCASTVPSAVADKGDRAYPSKDEVAAAKAQAENKARDVGAIKASLILANQRLEQAALRAEQASEAYNGAMWRLGLAKQKVLEAQAEAEQARRTVAEQRKSIGALVASSYQRGDELTALGAMMGADGPEGVLDQYAAFQGASTSLQADYDRYDAAESIAEVFERKAEEARADQAKLAGEARAAKDAAASAAEQALAAAAQIAAEKDQLIRELASAQNISVRLAQRRQTALEEIARERAVAQAQAAARAAARQEARRDAAAAAAATKARAEAAARDRAKARAEAKARDDRNQNSNDNNDNDNTPNPPAPAPSPPPPPPPPAPPAPPAPSGGADQAIAFAMAQLGEPYQWGAAGPDSWDCSGLMLGAWGSAGVYLPHYSAAQYYAGTPISSSDLRPGDMLFWGTSSSPDSIHHVAMYVGGGQMIHAPRTGRPVAIESMYYWIPPNLFARV